VEAELPVSDEDQPRPRRGRKPRGSAGLDFIYLWDMRPGEALAAAKPFVGREVVVSYYTARERGSRLPSQYAKRRIQGRLRKVGPTHGVLELEVESVTGVIVKLPLIMIYSIELYIPGWSSRGDTPPPPSRPQ
jgi:hypothetical protein